jgi:SAM-dependent methyltransferase
MEDGQPAASADESPEQSVFPAAANASYALAPEYEARATRAILSAAEVGVFDALSKRPKGLEALTKQLGLHRRGIRDLLDALVALHVLERNSEGDYSNRPGARAAVRARQAIRLDEAGRLPGEQHDRGWESLTTALRTGRPQNGMNGRDQYACLYSNDAAVHAFAERMTRQTLEIAPEIAASFPWQDHRSVADIGCAQGCLLVEIAKRHGHMRGCGFDLPLLRSEFENHVSGHGLAARLRFEAGDFFRDPLPSADVLIIGRVLHNWDLATKRLLLEKAHAALRPGGALIVYDRLIDDERRHNAEGLLASLNMLLNTAGGFDYTAADCMEWMAAAGFQGMSMQALAGSQSMIVGRS